MMDASYAASSLVQAFSQGRGFEAAGSMHGSGAGNMLAAALSGPLGAAIGGALATFAPLPPGMSQAIGAAVGGAIGTGAGIGGGMIGSLVDQFISEMMPILKLPEQVAQAGFNFLSEVVRNTAAISDGQRILEAAYNTLVESVDPVVRAFLPLAVVIHDVAAPIAQTFGVLLHNLGLFSGVAKLLFGAFKSLGIAALTVADFLATGNAEEQARLRDAREELLDLTYSEAEARAAAILASTDATEAVREFSEELRNVPIGVKRIRGLQFAATSGRFNSPAWGA